MMMIEMEVGTTTEIEIGVETGMKIGAVLC